MNNRVTSIFEMKAGELVASFKENDLDSWTKSDFFRAHRFYLGNVYSNIPQIFHEFGNELIKHNLFRLPFEYIMIEYNTLHNREELRTVLLCKQQLNSVVTIQPVFRINSNDWRIIGGEPLEFRIIDNKEGTFSCPDAYHKANFIEVAKACTSICLATVAFLASTSCFQQEIIAPRQLQRARERNGDAPLLTFKVLRLVSGSSKTFLLPIGSHRSPALHWRRGHYRQLPTGKLIPISPALVGSAINGIVEKAYDLRKSI